MDSIWLDRIVTFATSMVAWKVIEYLLNRKKSEFSILQDTWLKEIERLNKEISSLQTQLLDLKEETKFLKAKLSQVESIYPDLPIPMWLKDNNGRMISLNDAYEKAFLLPQNKFREDYIGNTDKEIWGDKIEKIFRRNDKKVLESHQNHIYIENEDLTHPLLKNWEFIKYPKYSEGVFIGIGGIGLPKNKQLK